MTSSGTMGERSPSHSRLEGISEFTDAIDAVIARADRRLRVFDRNLDGIGFNSSKRHELLRRFLLARRTNRLFIAVHDTSYLNRDCPRMQSLLKLFSQSMEIRQTYPHAQGVHDSFIIADDAHFLRRFHFDDSRSLLALDDPLETKVLNDRFEEIWDASFPAVFATTLGL